MNVSITVQGMAKVCRGDFPAGKISVTEAVKEPISVQNVPEKPRSRAVLVFVERERERNRS